MAASSDVNEVLSDAEIGQMEDWLFEFDRSWTEDALDKRINDLPDGGVALRQQMLVEAVKIDMERHWRKSCERSVESYLDRIPQIRQPDTVVGQIIETEVEIRRECGSHVDPDDFLRRFPSHADLLTELCYTDAHVSVEADLAARETVGADLTCDSVPATSTSIPAAMPEHFGRYRILRQLGEGAMGAVFLAEDSQLKRQVALKTPAFAGNASHEMIERFYTEAQSAATLRHPNICPVHDVGEIDGRHFISMAYIEGRVLSQFVRAGKPIPQRAVAAVIRKLARGLGHAHEHGVIHRDLKPGNVIIDQQNEPIVTDFGLARLVNQRDESRITQDGILLGTPAYMPPEQVQGKIDATGPHSDIYSLGIMMYELLTGNVPFQGHIASVLTQIMTEQPNPPSRSRDDLHPGLESICLRMIAKDPHDRFGSMHEVSNALAAFLKGESRAVSTDDGETAREEQPLKTTIARRQSAPAVSATMVGNDEMQALAKMFDAQASEGEPSVEAVERPSRRSGMPSKGWIFLATAAIACAAIYGTVLSIGSDKGTVKLELPDSVALSDIQVVIDGISYKLPRGGTLELEAGKHKVEIFHNQRRLSAETLLVVSGQINSVSVPTPTAGAAVSGFPGKDDQSVAQWLFDTGSWIKFRTADGVVHTRWNVEKHRGTRYAEPLPDEPFVLTVAWFYSSTAATEADMSRLRNLNSLETLSVGKLPLTSRGLSQIKQLPRLRTLYLGKTRVSEDGFRVVGEMNQLRALSLSGIENNDLSHLETLTGLASLSVHSKRVSDAGLQSLAKLTNLETLNLTGGAITGAGLQHLQGMNKLRILSLSSSSLVDSGLVHLEEHATLQHLTLSHTRVTNQGMQSVGKLKGLTHLDLGSTVVGDDGLRHLSGLLQLGSLNLATTRTTNEGLKELADLRKMQALNLYGTAVDDEGLVHLRDMTGLVKLNAANTNITGNGLQPLTELTAIVRLQLGGANFTAHAEALETLSHMKSRPSGLYLSGVELTPEQRDKLQKSLGERCRIFSGQVVLEEEDALGAEVSFPPPE